MLKTIEVKQAKLIVNGHEYYATHIPTATSGQWFTIHDICELWAAVAIDLDGTVVGWRNPPNEKWQESIVKAIRQEFDLPEPPKEKRKEYDEGETITCPKCGGDNLDCEESPDMGKCLTCGLDFTIKKVAIWEE